jgi:hypothetical protein
VVLAYPAEDDQQPALTGVLAHTVRASFLRQSDALKPVQP